MDEPLTVIDPDLKFRLRRKLKEINQKYKSTLIYVTHDQNEAMTFAENIIVMDDGEIVQVGSPAELFDRPKTTFVGYFIGAPAMNFLGCKAINSNTINFNGTEITTTTDLSGVKNKNLKLGIRSEYIKFLTSKGKNTVHASILNVDDWGNHKLVTADFDGNIIKIKVKRETEVPTDRAFLTLPAKHCCVYDNEILV